MKVISFITIAALSLILGGCATQQPQGPKNNPYTQGNVSLTLKKGVTTGAEVAKVFGAPNIVTQDGNGNQVWIYQKDNVTIQSGGTRGYFTILIAGVSSGSGSYQQSSRTMTLTIYFNKHGRVRDFKSMTTSF